MQLLDATRSSSNMVYNLKTKSQQTDQERYKCVCACVFAVRNIGFGRPARDAKHLNIQLCKHRAKASICWVQQAHGRLAVAARRLCRIGKKPSKQIANQTRITTCQIEMCVRWWFRSWYGKMFELDWRLISVIVVWNRIKVPMKIYYVICHIFICLKDRCKNLKSMHLKS